MSIDTPELADNLSAPPEKRITYPEQRTYPWETNPSITRAVATNLLRKMTMQGGSQIRKTALNAAADALDEIADDRMLDTFSGKQVKKVLIAAAHDAGWYADTRPKRLALPEVADADTKACYRCKEVKPKADFETTPTAAQIKVYQWKDDTARTRLSPLCSVCRKSNADKTRRKRVRANRKREMTYEMAIRMQAFTRVRKQIDEHLNRVRSAISNAKKPLRIPNDITGDIEVWYDYQFRDEDTKDYYYIKRDMLMLCRDRLHALLGEDTPIPARWGMLLSNAEQHKLQELHTQAFLNAKKPAALW